MEIKELIEASIEARKSSYSPYSGYSVGAALLCKDGSIITGANIENASYGGTVCAERVAVFKAVNSGIKEFEAIAITGGNHNEEAADYAYPCGICRQVLREFTNPSIFKVFVAKNPDEYEEYTLEDLLPKSFGPENLA